MCVGASCAGQLKLEYFVERIAGARHRNHGVDFGALLRRAEGDQRPFTVADQHDAAEILPGEVLGPCRGVADEVVERGVGHFVRVVEFARSDAPFVVAERGDTRFFKLLRQIEVVVRVAVAGCGT